MVSRPPWPSSRPYRRGVRGRIGLHCCAHRQYDQSPWAAPWLGLSTCIYRLGNYPGSGGGDRGTVPKGAATGMVAEDVEAKGQPGGKSSPEPCGLQARRDGLDATLLADVRHDGDGSN